MSDTHRELSKANSYGKKYLKNPSGTKQYRMQAAIIEEVLSVEHNLSKINRIKDQVSNPPDVYEDIPISALGEVWNYG